MRKQISVSIDEKIIEAFKQYTASNGMTVSGRIEALIKEDMKKGKKG